MKQVFTSICFLLSIIAGAQNDLVVFSEDGQPFTLYVNGSQQNDAPETRVKAEGITNGAAAVRVVFADKSKEELRKNMSFLTPDTEVTAKITMTKKGLRLKYFGEAPIGTTEVAVGEPYVEAEAVGEAVEEVEQPATTTTIVTEEVTMKTGVQAGEGAEGESVNMKVGINGVNFNMGVDVSDGTMGSATTTTTTTTTTTSSSSSSIVQERPMDVIVVDEGPCGPVSDQVSGVRSAMEAEAFADDKMNVGKQALRNSCVRVSSIKELAMLFSFEDDKLEFVKYCYERCYDPENYYQLNSIFNFGDSKEDLNRFLESR